MRVRRSERVEEGPREVQILRGFVPFVSYERRPPPRLESETAANRQQDRAIHLREVIGRRVLVERRVVVEAPEDPQRVILLRISSRRADGSEAPGVACRRILLETQLEGVERVPGVDVVET